MNITIDFSNKSKVINLNSPILSDLKEKANENVKKEERKKEEVKEEKKKKRIL